MPATDTRTTAEVAAALGVHVKTVHRMVREGRLTPLLKVPGRTGAYIFTAEEAARVVAEQGKGPAGKPRSRPGPAPSLNPSDEGAACVT
jgi:excisionase family DNA binding protein